MSCGVGHRCGSDSMLLWHRQEAENPVRTLAWELPYAVDAVGVALKKSSSSLTSLSGQAWPQPVGLEGKQILSSPADSGGMCYGEGVWVKAAPLFPGLPGITPLSLGGWVSSPGWVGAYS